MMYKSWIFASRAEPNLVWAQIYKESWRKTSWAEKLPAWAESELIRTKLSSDASLDFSNFPSKILKIHKEEKKVENEWQTLRI